VLSDAAFGLAVEGLSLTARSPSSTSGELTDEELNELPLSADEATAVDTDEAQLKPTTPAAAERSTRAKGFLLFPRLRFTACETAANALCEEPNVLRSTAPSRERCIFLLGEAGALILVAFPNWGLARLLVAAPLPATTPHIDMPL
jgi:hypothetical protein